VVQPKNILKTHFQTGDAPTQSEFEGLIDSFRHLDEISFQNEVEFQDGATSQNGAFTTGTYNITVKDGIITNAVNTP